MSLIRSKDQAPVYGKAQPSPLVPGYAFWEQMLAGSNAEVTLVLNERRARKKEATCTLVRFQPVALFLGSCPARRIRITEIQADEVLPPEPAAEQVPRQGLQEHALGPPPLGI